MKKLLFIILLIAPGTSCCQIEAKTSDGKAVLLSNDGTWKYIEPEAARTTPSDEESQLSLAEKLDIRRFIEQSEMDPIENLHRILTRVIRIDHGAGFKYRSIGKTIFLIFSRDDTDVIGSNDALIFLFTNGKKMSLKSTGIQSGDVQYYISFEQVKLLATHKLALVRFYTTEGYSDFKTSENPEDTKVNDRIRVPLSDPEQIIRLSKLFLNEYLKYNK